MTDDDRWTAEATGHDALVVDLLLQLKHSFRPPPTRPSASASAANLGWGVKQPRSAGSNSKERIGRRRSPCTPLSWSGGSGGDGVEGCEASSLLTNTNRSPVSRSKINLDGGVSGASSSKLRKKKTYTELMDEEEILLKESMHLNQDLVMLGSTVSEQRIENENLKRIKLDFITKLAKNDTCTARSASGSKDAASRQVVMKAEVYDCVPSTLSQCRPIPSAKSCKAECDTFPAQKRANFTLPDLNMMPPE